MTDERATDEQTTDEQTTDLVVIGAGVAGLVAAKELAGSREVVVLDKGRGVGGRVATHRIDVAAADGVGATAIVDHGVPFLEDGQRDVGGVTRLAKRLAEDLDVRLAHRVDRLEVRRGGWRVAGMSPDGRFAIRASALLVTAPVPQTLELLAASEVDLAPDVDATLRSVRYDPCIVVLAALDGSSGLEPDGTRGAPAAAVDLVVDHHLVGASPVPAVSVRASREASEALWSVPDDEVAARLLEAAALGSRPVDGTVQVHRWRYARCATPVHASHQVAITDPPLVLAGDAFGAGAGLDVARRSGVAAAGVL